MKALSRTGEGEDIEDEIVEEILSAGETDEEDDIRG